MMRRDAKYRPPSLKKRFSDLQKARLHVPGERDSYRKCKNYTDIVNSNYIEEFLKSS